MTSVRRLEEHPATAMTLFRDMDFRFWLSRRRPNSQMRDDGLKCNWR